MLSLGKVSGPNCCSLGSGVLSISLLIVFGPNSGDVENIPPQSLVMVGLVIDAGEVDPRENLPVAPTPGPRTPRLPPSQNPHGPVAPNNSVLGASTPGPHGTPCDPLISTPHMASVLYKHTFQTPKSSPLLLVFNPCSQWKELGPVNGATFRDGMCGCKRKPQPFSPHILPTQVFSASSLQAYLLLLKTELCLLEGHP